MTEQERMAALDAWNFVSDFMVTHPMTAEESRRFHRITNQLRAVGVLPPLKAPA